MSNSLESYQERIAGLSPDPIRSEVKKFSINYWNGIAVDVGIGSGGWSRHLVSSNKFNKIIGVDILDCRDNELKDIEFHIVNLAMEKLPFEENSIDCIFAIEVLEHLENPRFFMREVFRVLKPGGQFIMSTPSCDSLTSKISYSLRGYFPAFCDHDYLGSGHITPISSLDFKRISKEAGFEKIYENFSMPGRIPSLKTTWQKIFPFMKGILWSDSFLARCEK